MSLMGLHTEEIVMIPYVYLFIAIIHVHEILFLSICDA